MLGEIAERFTADVPYDLASVCVIAASGLLLVACVRLRGAGARVACLLAAAFIIRFDAAWQFSLHSWDERYHAVVARNLIDDPLRPTLYRTPVLPYDHRQWTANHVWLHKPPLALWLMAGSMRAFGEHEIAMRLPSVVLSTCGVWLTFFIGRRLFGEPAGLLAAGFHAVNGFLVALASGRRVADHVDTALVFFVELGIWAALAHRDTGRRPWLVWAGAALGAAVLSKSAPGLLVAAVAVAVFSRRWGIGEAMRRTALLCLAGGLVAAPWLVYTALAFPAEARYTTVLTFRHLTAVVENDASHPLMYLRDMPRFFGELVWLPLSAAVVTAVRRRQAGLVECLVWAAVPYVTFSLAATRLPNFVMIAAPALFLLQARYWCALREARSRMHGWRRRAAGILLALLAVLPGRYLLEPTGSFERRDRRPAEFEDLRTLDARLPGGPAVVFNVPRAVEAMFYSRHPVYPRLPTGDEVRALTARGLRVVVYEPPGTVAPIPPSWNVTRVGPGPSR